MRTLVFLSESIREIAAAGSVFVASMQTGGLYASFDSGRSWDRVLGPQAEGFFAALAPSNAPGVFFAASATEGLYLMEWPGSTANSSSFLDQPEKQTARVEVSPGS